MGAMELLLYVMIAWGMKVIADGASQVAAFVAERIERRTSR